MIKTVAIVDDKPMLIQSLKEGLELFEDIQLVFTANNGKEALEELTILRSSELPDVILMDIEMPLMNGIEATAAVKKQFPQVKVLMLTVFDQDDKIFDAVLAGANGYLLKEEKVHKVVEAVEDVLDGGAPMSSSIAFKTLKLLRGQNPATQSTKDFQLTKREVEILENLVEGLTYQKIAEKLFISPKTVRKHIENIYQKLHVHSKVEAVQVAMKNRWFNMNMFAFF